MNLIKVLVFAILFSSTLAVIPYSNDPEDDDDLSLSSDENEEENSSNQGESYRYSSIPNGFVWFNKVFRECIFLASHEFSYNLRITERFIFGEHYHGMGVLVKLFVESKYQYP